MPKRRKAKIAVFCSGNGSNLQAILDAERKGKLGAEVALVICDKPEAFALVRANRAGKPSALMQPKEFTTRRAYETALVRVLKKAGVRYIALAGFMRILTPTLINAFAGRILNIHPSLLPAFAGPDGIGDALRHGVKVTGVTVHIATAELDNGPIVLQEAVAVRDGETRKTLAQRIHRVEHRLYPKAIRLLVQGKIKIKGRTTQTAIARSA